MSAQVSSFKFVKSPNKEWFQPILRRLVKVFKPEQIYLFGSHAWGEPEEGSDVDLMVIVSASDLTPLQRMVKAQQNLVNVKAPIDVIVKTRAEFEYYRDVYASLERQILDEGILLYDRSQK
mgnify:CR=1 FL=1